MSDEVDWRGRPVQNVPYKGLFVMCLVILPLVLSYIFIFPSFISPSYRNLYLPSPKELFNATIKMRSMLLQAAIATCWRATISFTAGSSFGMMVAFAMYRFRWFSAAASAVIEPIRPLPPVALLIFLSLWFGGSWLGWFLLISLGSFMVLVVETREALRKLDPNLIRAARSLGAHGSRYYRWVLFPAVFQRLLAPLRVSLALAFAVAVAAEYMGVQTGLGQMMLVAQPQLDTASITMLLIVLTIEAAFCDKLLRVIVTKYNGRRFRL